MICYEKIYKSGPFTENYQLANLFNSNTPIQNYSLHFTILNLSKNLVHVYILYQIVNIEFL